MSSETNDAPQASVVKDFTGKPLIAGDKIVYPVRRGSRLWLENATVMSVNLGALGCTKSNGRRVTIKNLSNVVKV